jgi:uncharacterized membrane protein YbjE (DUF340 family)
MLWDMLILAGATATFLSALEQAKRAKAGIGGYTLAVAIGLLLAACNVVAVHKAGEAVGGRIERLSESVQERCFGALHLAALLWIVFAMFLAGWVASTALRLAF